MDVSHNKPEDRLLGFIDHLKSLPLMSVPLEDVRISPPQIALLARVARNPGIGVLDIAKEVHLSPPTVSVGIRRLVRAGWLERRRDPHDRRARPLFLTSEGESLMLKVREHRYRMLQMFLSALNQQEQDRLIDLLERGVMAVKVSLEREDG